MGAAPIRHGPPCTLARALLFKIRAPGIQYTEGANSSTSLFSLSELPLVLVSGLCVRPARAFTRAATAYTLRFSHPPTRTSNLLISGFTAQQRTRIWAFWQISGHILDTGQYHIIIYCTL